MYNRKIETLAKRLGEMAGRTAYIDSPLKDFFSVLEIEEKNPRVSRTPY